MAQLMECKTDHVPYYSEAAGYNDLLLMKALSLDYNTYLPLEVELQESNKYFSYICCAKNERHYFTIRRHTFHQVLFSSRYFLSKNVKSTSCLNRHTSTRGSRTSGLEQMFCLYFLGKKCRQYCTYYHDSVTH